MNYFIVNMVVVDFLIIVFNMLFIIYWIFCGLDIWVVGGWIGEVFCKLLFFV